MENNNVLKSIGVKLTDLRTKQNKTVTEVSRAAGVAASTVSNVEAGAQGYNVNNLFAIAEALGFDLRINLVAKPKEIIELV